jgi:hypothetical protein
VGTGTGTGVGAGSVCGAETVASVTILSATELANSSVLQAEISSAKKTVEVVLLNLDNKENVINALQSIDIAHQNRMALLRRV